MNKVYTVHHVLQRCGQDSERWHVNKSNNSSSGDSSIADSAVHESRYLDFKKWGLIFQLEMPGSTIFFKMFAFGGNQINYPGWQ